MASQRFSLRVELVRGHGEDFWPWPGRDFAVSTTHTFDALAAAIDEGFARWDRDHLYQFWLPDGREIGVPDPDDAADPVIDALTAAIGPLTPGTQFVYEFDFGDCWDHLCSVGNALDPAEVLEVPPDLPVAYWGWGNIPDQYLRRFAEDEGDGSAPPAPGKIHLPPLGPFADAVE